VKVGGLDRFSSRSGIVAFGFPLVGDMAVEAVFAVSLTLLLATFFGFFALFTAIAHGVPSSSPILREGREAL